MSSTIAEGASTGGSLLEDRRCAMVAREGPLSPVPRDCRVSRALALPPSPPNSDQFDRKLDVILFSHVCRRVSPRRRPGRTEGGRSVCLGFSSAKFRFSWGMDSTRSKETKEAATLFPRIFYLRQSSAEPSAFNRLNLVRVHRDGERLYYENVTRGEAREIRVVVLL